MIAHPDTMHTKHGGSDAYLYGSVLKYIVKDRTPSANEKQNLSVFWNQLKDAMKNDGSSNRFAYLTLTVFDHGDDRPPHPQRTGSADQASRAAIVGVFSPHL